MSALDSEEARRAVGTVVMKFGGTSVADPEKLRQVARRLVAAREAGNRVVGVLSAMGETTDELLRLANDISSQPKPRELDMLISVGERISCALAAMAIHDLGHDAISLTGSQAGIVTDTVHGKARIVEVRPRRVEEALDNNKLVLVAGFQGVSTERDVTTLGRGGSDTTAVALAAALGADSCEIYTDVDGVYTADPRVVPNARKLAAVAYDEMLELAESGARVLHVRSVELARTQGVRLHVRSTFSDADGTWICPQDGQTFERAEIAGVAHTYDEIVYRLRSGTSSQLLADLADRGVRADAVAQSEEESVLAVSNEDRVQAEDVLGGVGVEWSSREDLGKVTLVGAGVRSDPAIGAQVFAALAEAGIETELVATSPVKIACHVLRHDVERAVRTLHAAFELDRERVNA